MLEPYYLTRLYCPECGVFEMGARDRPTPDFTCPWCDGPLGLQGWCRGETCRPLPFTTDPRPDAYAGRAPIEIINQQASNNSHPRHHVQSTKSTGRPPGGSGHRLYRGPSDQRSTREADHARHCRNKIRA